MNPQISHPRANGRHNLHIIGFIMALLPSGQVPLLPSGEAVPEAVPESDEDIALREATQQHDLVCNLVAEGELELQREQDFIAVLIRQGQQQGKQWQAALPPSALQRQQELEAKLVTVVDEIQQLEGELPAMDARREQLLEQLRTERQRQTAIAQDFVEVPSAGVEETEAARKVLEKRWQQHEQGWQQQERERQRLKDQRKQLMKLVQGQQLVGLEQGQGPDGDTEGGQAREEDKKQPCGSQQRQQQGVGLEGGLLDQGVKHDLQQLKEEELQEQGWLEQQQEEGAGCATTGSSRRRVNCQGEQQEEGLIDLHQQRQQQGAEGSAKGGAGEWQDGKS